MDGRSNRRNKAGVLNSSGAVTETGPNSQLQINHAHVRKFTH